MVFNDFSNLYFNIRMYIGDFAVPIKFLSQLWFIKAKYAKKHGDAVISR